MGGNDSEAADAPDDGQSNRDEIQTPTIVQPRVSSETRVVPPNIRVTDEFALDSLVSVLHRHPEPVIVASNVGNVRYANRSALALGDLIAEGQLLPPVLLDLVRRASVTNTEVSHEYSLGTRVFHVTACRQGSATSVYFHEVSLQSLGEQFNDALNRINQLVHSLRDFDAIIREAIQEASAVLRADTAAVSLRCSRGWVLRFAHGLPEASVGTEMNDAEEPHALHAIQERVAIAIDDTWNDHRVNQTHMRKWGIRAVLVLPLIIGGEPLGVVFFNYHGKPQSFLQVHIDFGMKLASTISLAIENARLFKELDARERGLREADRRKNEFSAALSHELRNPLGPIKSSLFVLQRAEPGSHQAHQAITVIDRQTGLLSHLVDDLLDVTRVTRERLALHRCRLELNELVNDVVDDNRLLFERAGVRLYLRLAPTAVYVNGDKTRLRQVILNLLQNSLKFTEFDGHTWVSVERDATSATVRVRDSGVGMTPDTLERLFEPFTQAPRTLEKSRGGLGLGLALVKGLVELHDGTVLARSDGLVEDRSSRSCSHATAMQRCLRSLPRLNQTSRPGEFSSLKTT